MIIQRKTESDIPDSILPPLDETDEVVEVSERPVIGADPQADAWGGQDYPRVGDTWYYIGRKLQVYRDSVYSDFVSAEKTSYIIKDYCSCGNCFKTKEEAEQVLSIMLGLFTPKDIK